MNKITPFFWFDTQAEEAMNYYVDTFNGAPYKKQESRIIEITRYEKGMEAPGADAMEGKVQLATGKGTVRWTATRAGG